MDDIEVFAEKLKFAVSNAKSAEVKKKNFVRIFIYLDAFAFFSILA